MNEEISMGRTKWLEYQEQMFCVLQGVILQEIESFERGTGLKVKGIGLVHLFDGRRVSLEVKA